MAEAGAGAERRWAGPLLALLAVAFQLQVTLPVSDVGLRISAADLLVPALFPAMAVVAWRRGSLFPRWRVAGLWVWLGALSAWLLVALLHGRWVTGEWLGWAVVNKFLGWFVLLGYLLLGGWVGAALERPARERFLKALFLAGWTIAAASVTFFALIRFGLPVVDNSASLAWRVEGFFNNPNAYGYFTAVLIALQSVYLVRGELFSRRGHRFGLTVTVLALILSGSRTAWIAAAVAILVLHRMKALDLREIGRALLISTVFAGGIYFGPVLTGPVLDFGIQGGAGRFGFSLSDAYVFRSNPAGIEYRWKSTVAALDAWRSHPVLGVGLGTSLWEQLRTGEKIITLIHNTALWLLTETGLVGLLMFAAFFFVILRALLGGGDGVRDPFRTAVFGAMVVFAVASLGVEALYQRHLWFLLGLALAVPLPPPRARARAPTPPGI